MAGGQVPSLPVRHLAYTEQVDYMGSRYGAVQVRGGSTVQEARTA
jgi:hypothetical protein